MYRLPTQFDPAGRQEDLSAAGGGSTSTTCSSCVATLGVASATTAMIFHSLGAAAAPAAQRPPTEAPASEAAPAPSGLPAAPPATVPPMSASKRTTLGATALLMALAAGAACAFLHPMFGALAFLATYLSIFCIVYERSRLSAARGAGIGILMLIAVVVFGLAEMYIWMQNL